VKVIDCHDLCFTYPGGKAALRGVELTLSPDERLVLFGANGSGKSTFVRHLNGFLQGQGQLHVCGLEVNATNAKELRRLVGMVFQDASAQLFCPTVIDDVQFGLLVRDVPRAQAMQRAMAALERCGALHLKERATSSLSAGEKRRVALAGVIVLEPQLLVLDEPTTFLDPPGRRELAALLQELRMPQLIVTHDIGFARQLATRAVFFAEGRAEASGNVDEIVARYHWD
jgi:cobalt/nickel transport system ATP-binding protein